MKEIFLFYFILYIYIFYLLNCHEKHTAHYEIQYIQSTEQNLNQSSIFWTKITVKSTLLMLQMGHTNDCYRLA